MEIRKDKLAMSKSLLTLVLCASLGFCRSGIAQQPAPPLPVYDVVSIKLNHSLSGRVSSNMDDTSYRAVNVTLKHLLVNAYGIREGLISGLPGWADSPRYDITAKVTDPDVKTLRSLSRDQQQAMLAAVLVNRFHLQTHVELKTLPVYELVIAKDGPSLAVSAVPQDPANPDRVGLGKFDIHNGDMTATGATMSDLVGNLSYTLDRTVIDKTGLTGRYDFHLQWTPDSASGVAADNSAPDAPPNIFTAIQLQLGLKLQPAKGPVPTLIVDHVEQPTEN